MTDQEVIQKAQRQLANDKAFVATVDRAAKIVEKEWRDQTLQVPNGSQQALMRRAAAVAAVLAEP